MEEIESPFENEIINTNITDAPQEKPQKLTAEFLQEKLSALREAFEPFYNECGFYSVEIRLQGNFNSEITKALKKMDYETKLHPEGFIENKSKNINVILT